MCSLLVLGHEVLALALGEEVAQVRERADLHLLLRVARLGAHVREERGVGELKQARVDLRLVREHVQPDTSKLQGPDHQHAAGRITKECNIRDHPLGHGSSPPRR